MLAQKEGSHGKNNFNGLIDDVREGLKRMFSWCSEILTLPQKCSHAVASIILTLELSLSLFKSEGIFRVLEEKTAPCSLCLKRIRRHLWLLDCKDLVAREARANPPHHHLQEGLVVEEKQLRPRRHCPTGTWTWLATDPTQFSFENNWVAGNPKYRVITDILG